MISNISLEKRKPTYIVIFFVDQSVQPWKYNAYDRSQIDDANHGCHDKLSNGLLIAWDTALT